MNLSRIAIVLALLTAVGCSEKSVAPGDQPGVAGPAPTATSEDQFLETKYNLGDVETAVLVTTKLAPESQGGSVTYTETETKKYELAIAEAKVVEPYPTHLWVTTLTKSRRQLRTQDAILLRHRVYIDGVKEPIASMNSVWPGAEATHLPLEQKVDVMPFIKEFPTSILVYTKTEVVWLPDTDANVIDPNYEPDTAQRNERLSNTLRITFE